MISRSIRGLLAGGSVAALALLVGLIRAAVVVMSGKSVAAPTRSDVVMIAYYVAGFAVAGLLVAAIWPLMRGRISTYFGFALAGVIVCIAILAGQDGGLPARDLADWIFVVLLGPLFGCAFAYGFTRNIPDPQPNEELKPTAAPSSLVE